MRSDIGIGIEKESLNHSFSPFFSFLGVLLCGGYIMLTQNMLKTKGMLSALKQLLAIGISAVSNALKLNAVLSYEHGFKAQGGRLT